MEVEIHPESKFLSAVLQAVTTQLRAFYFSLEALKKMKYR